VLSVEPAFGVENLPSDNMNHVMSNHFANEFAEAQYQRKVLEKGEKK